MGTTSEATAGATPLNAANLGVAATAPVERMQARVGGANIRMYRQGLGDAFLLAFDRGKGDVNDPMYVLIDCGVILGTPDPTKPLTAVIENIIAATGGRIHQLIITHEHWDHVGSFQQLFELWKQATVDAVWMAWTEDPKDPLAVQLKQQFKNDLDALCMAVIQQRKTDSDYQAAQRAGISSDELPSSPFWSLVGLFGEPDHIINTALNGASLSTATSFSTSTHVGMQNARSLTQPENVSYLAPGTSLDLPQTEPGAVRVHVLGPPRNADLLKDINPSTRDPETYSNPPKGSSSVTPSLDAPLLAPNEKSAFTLALRNHSTSPLASRTPLTADEKYVAEICLPFEPFQGVELNGPQAQALYPEYHAQQNSWRKIDDDWLAVGGELALQMDSYTNNTSLALAFELQNGEVLLFPADAQVGNWLSWDSITPPLTNHSGQPVTVASLLERTKLYKVGHHGSHNATMRAQGLERMTDPELIALLPVDEDVAHNKKHWNEMPFGPLLARLYVKTGGRVIRADQGVVTTAKPVFLQDADWQGIQPIAQNFAEHNVRTAANALDARVKPDLQGKNCLYYEVSIPL